MQLSYDIIIIIILFEALTGQWRNATKVSIFSQHSTVCYAFNKYQLVKHSEGMNAKFKID